MLFGVICNAASGVAKGKVKLKLCGLLKVSKAMLTLIRGFWMVFEEVKVALRKLTCPVSPAVLSQVTRK